MNKYEIPFQGVPRRLDTQAARSSVPALNGWIGKHVSNGTGDFRSLLEGLSDEMPQEDSLVAESKLNATILGDDVEFMTATPTADERSVGDLIRSLVSEGMADATAAGQTGSQTSSSILSALQEILPRIHGQNGAGGDAEGKHSGSSALRPNVFGMGWEGSESSLSIPTAKPALKVDVQHQETHFKPIVEGFSLKAEDDRTASPEGQVASAAKSVIGATSAGGQRAQGLELPAANINAAMSEVREEQTEIRGTPIHRDAARTDMTPQAGEASPKAEGNASLPPGVLHRIAGAVLAEGRSMAAELNMHPSHMDGKTIISSTRAADGVLRVLNLQLRPAELGLVTIKMRLAGDSLEMDLQVSSEETARLLKSDSEKLTSLLKGAGYRPDVININVGGPETAQQDGTASQRQQFPSQSQHQSGGGQDGHSRQQGNQYGHERTGVRSDATEDSASHDRRSGGVYL